MKIETLIPQTLGNHDFCMFATFLLFTPFNHNFGGKKITEVYLHKLRADHFSKSMFSTVRAICTRVGTLIVATIYLQLIQNRYMFRSFTVLQCSHQHCVQPVASDVEVVGYL